MLLPESVNNGRHFPQFPLILGSSVDIRTSLGTGCVTCPHIMCRDKNEL